MEQTRRSVTDNIFNKDFIGLVETLISERYAISQKRLFLS